MDFDTEGYYDMLKSAEKWFCEHRDELRNKRVNISEPLWSSGTAHDSIAIPVETQTHYGTAMIWVSGLADFDSIAKDAELSDVKVVHFEFKSPTEVGPALDAFINRLSSSE